MLSSLPLAMPLSTRGGSGLSCAGLLCLGCLALPGPKNAEPVGALPLWRLAPAVLPIVGSPALASENGLDLRSGEGGKVIGEAHRETIPGKIKSAMPKIILAIRRHCRHIRDVMNLNASKNITAEIKVVARLNEIQVRIGDRVEYVWFCNNINEARYRWVCAVDAAKRLAERVAA